MIVKQMTEFRKNMKQTLDQVNDNDETVIISRTGDRDVVLISLKNFNSIQETLYLQSSKKNKERLEKAMRDVEDNLNIVSHEVIL